MKSCKVSISFSFDLLQFYNYIHTVSRMITIFNMRVNSDAKRPEWALATRRPQTNRAATIMGPGPTLDACVYNREQREYQNTRSSTPGSQRAGALAAATRGAGTQLAPLAHSHPNQGHGRLGRPHPPHGACCGSLASPAESQGQRAWRVARGAWGGARGAWGVALIASSCAPSSPWPCG